MEMKTSKLTRTDNIYFIFTHIYNICIKLIVLSNKTAEQSKFDYEIIKQKFAKVMKLREIEKPFILNKPIKKYFLLLY